MAVKALASNFQRGIVLSGTALSKFAQISPRVSTLDSRTKSAIARTLQMKSPQEQAENQLQPLALRAIDCHTKFHDQVWFTNALFPSKVFRRRFEGPISLGEDVRKECTSLLEEYRSKTEAYQSRIAALQPKTKERKSVVKELQYFLKGHKILDCLIGDALEVENVNKRYREPEKKQPEHQYTSSTSLSSISE